MISSVTILAKGYWKSVLDQIRKQRKTKPSTFSAANLAKLKRQESKWKSQILKPWTGTSPERKKEFRNPSNIPIQRLYTPEDVAYHDEIQQSGLPGEYPYLRGVYPT